MLAHVPYRNLLNNADVGVHAVTVRATDGDGAFAEDTFNITVTNVNDKPVVTLDTTGGAAANAATFVESTGVDANDNQVSFVKGTGASIEDVDTGDLLGTLKVDFAHNLAASDQLIIAGGSSGADVAVALNTANGGTGTVTVNSVAYTYTVANDGSSAASISFAPASAVSPAEMDNLLKALQYNNTSDTPTNDATITFGVSVTDDSGSSATDGTAATSAVANFTVTLDETNDTPTVANVIADQSTAEDASFTYQVPANTFQDLDGDDLTYGITGLPSSGNLSFDASTRTVSGTPNNADVGVHAVTVKATDGDGAFAEDTFNITVTNVNDKPVVTLDTTGGAAANAATFVESDGVDANNNQVSFVKGTGASIEDVDTGDLLGTLKVDFAHNLAASDQLIIAGGGSSGADVAVALNTANGGNGTVTVNSVAYTYTVANDGSSAASIGFAPASAVSPAEMDNLLKALQYNNTSDTPTNDATITFGVSVTDDSGSSATDGTAATSAVANFTVTLDETNDTPVVTLDAAGGNANNTGTFTESDGPDANNNQVAFTNGTTNLVDLILILQMLKFPLHLIQ